MRGKFTLDDDGRLWLYFEGPVSRNWLKANMLVESLDEGHGNWTLRHNTASTGEVTACADWVLEPPSP